MLRKIFTAVCLGCGGECGYREMLCEDCVSKLPEPEHHCMGCGHPLAVNAYYCKNCDDKEKGVDFYYADYLYTGALRAVIYKIKYDWYFRGAAQLGSLCKIDDELLNGYDAIVPVPYHFRRRFVRFLQPVNMITAALASRTSTPVKALVKRAVHTEYQSRLRRKDRIKNVKNAFELTESVDGLNILVVDDIVTTGATVKEIASLLKSSGATSVDVYSLMTGIPR